MFSLSLSLHLLVVELARRRRGMSHLSARHSSNYWLINDRLRSKNLKLSVRQQSSCHLAFYSLSLAILCAVLSIVIYRFTDECSSSSAKTPFKAREFSLRCFKDEVILLLLAVSFFALNLLLCAGCRYFCSQPTPSTLIEPTKNSISSSLLDSEQTTPPFLYDQFTRPTTNDDIWLKRSSVELQ